ncbi:hypothetical protein A2884_01270 [Candidatus Saccharibacteria bacterium RIFCSPHIGHO2_01_FULL_48_12]|nr:MAG: hypothetical protein A2884_01270 [Candidatus Saccharibacteria bacterium RIFCSPHIGHO2_01_FULL_48_12]
MSTKKPPKAAKPSKETVYIDVDDEITTIIDKVENSSEKIVALVLPKRASVLQSTVNMRLLKRSAQKAKKTVVLVTSDASLLPLAGIAGLHTAKNLHSKPVVPDSPTGKPVDTDSTGEEGELDPIGDPESTKLDYHRSVGALAAAHAVADDGEVIDLEDQPQGKGDEKDKKTTPKDKKLKIPDFDRFRLKMLIAAGAGLALLTFLFLAVFVLPKATIIVKTTSVPVSADFTLTTSDTATALDEKNMIIPAALKTKDQTVKQSVPATGQQNNGEKATGSISLKNCGANSVTVPAGTGVSSSGLTFITQSSTSLNSGNFDILGNCKSSGDHIKSVNVIAQTGGAKYNIAPSSFSVQGYSAVTGSSSSAMSGGTDNIVTTVSQADIDKVKQQITSESSDQFSKDFLEQLQKEGLYPITATQKLSDPQVTSTPGIGQPASSAQVTVKVTYSVLTVKETDLETVVTNQLNKNIDKKKQKLSTDDVLKGLTVSLKEQKSPTVVVMDVSQTSSAVPIIDQPAVRKLAAGQKTSTIKAALNGIAGVEDVEVHLSPFWVSKAPSNTSKITIIQQEIKGDQTNETP